MSVTGRFSESRGALIGGPEPPAGKKLEKKDHTENMVLLIPLRNAEQTELLGSVAHLIEETQARRASARMSPTDDHSPGRLDSPLWQRGVGGDFFCVPRGQATRATHPSPHQIPPSPPLQKGGIVYQLSAISLQFRADG